MNSNSYWVTVSSRGFSDNNLLKLINYNPDGIRINTGRDSYNWAKKTINFLVENSYPVSKIFLDIGNNKSRIQLRKTTEYSVNEGSVVKINIEEHDDVDGVVLSTLFFEHLSDNDIVLFGDGEIKCKVERVCGTSAFLVACNSGIITNLSAINIENKNYSRFHVDLNEYNNVKRILTDYKISLIVSFIESLDNILWVENNFPEANLIMPKIETDVAIRNLDEIMYHSNLILLGRGDLALSVGVEKLGIVQKKVLEIALKYKSDVVIASGSLESLLYNDVPNRSDIIDITNSYLSGASGIMLTSETGASKTPFAIIDFLVKIMRYLESEIC